MTFVILHYIYIFIHSFVFFETKVDCHELPSNSIFRCPHFHPHRARPPIEYNEKPLLPALLLFCFLFMTSSKRRLTVMNFHLILSSAVLLTLLHTGPDFPLNTTRNPYCRHLFVSCSWHILKAVLRVGPPEPTHQISHFAFSNSWSWHGGSIVMPNPQG